MTDYFFGEVQGNPPGTTYPTRKAVMEAGVHQVGMAGISGNADVGANSIVVSGGYADDEDHGSWIIYTGAGGRDPATGRQVEDQTLAHFNNAALLLSEANGLPVRLTRGSAGEQQYAPPSGYRYDGLFRVATHWAELGRDGFQVWRFRLEQIPIEEGLSWSEPASDVASTGSLPAGNETVIRRSGVVQRIVRNSKVAEAVKRLYRYRCQICAVGVLEPVGRYAEGAHIRALGRPHNGPDTTDNVLCLCPNHHVQFDKGVIYVDDALAVRDVAGDIIGDLSTVPGHTPSKLHFAYHREHFGLDRLVVGAVIVDSIDSPTAVLATRRSANVALSGMWEFPGGKVEPGESAREALVRELMEELSVTAEAGNEITADMGYWPVSHESRLRLFVSQILSGNPSLADAHDEFLWIPIGDLDRLEWLPADASALSAVRRCLLNR